MITFDNITLVSKVISTKKHRSEDCDPTTEVCGIKLAIPLIASPMPDVCNGEMAAALATKGALGIIHRFQSIEAEVNEFSIAGQKSGCAIGVTGDFETRFLELAKAGCRVFCLDTANGANMLVHDAIKSIRLVWSTFKESHTEKLYLIAGNVATVEGYNFLADLGVDAVRIGIAGGSVCETRTETGVYMPTLQSVWDIAIWRHQQQPRSMPKIIADGGIRIPADMNKCLVCLADAVMCGSIFAGTKEAPGDVLKIENKLYKLYRGAASYSVQQETGKTPFYNEGNETIVPYKGDVCHVVDRFMAGLQSSMSYMDAGNLNEYRAKATVKRLDQRKTLFYS